MSITVSSVKAMLGENSNSVGALCKSSKVQPFSKYKPVSYNKTTEMTDADFRAAKYGMKMNYVESSTINPDAIKQAAQLYWEYDRPKGSGASPYRLGDFRKYNHDADDSMLSISVPKSVNSASASNMEFSINQENDNDYLEEYGRLSAKDYCESIVNLEDTSICYALFDRNDKVVTYGTANDNLCDADMEIYNQDILVPIKGLYQANYTLYVCLAIWVDTGRWRLFPVVDRVEHARINFSTVFPISIINDTVGSGGGIANPGKDVAFAPSFSSTYALAENCTDEFSGRSVMYNSSGDLLIKCVVKNTGASKTITRSSITLKNYWSASAVKSMTATYIYASQPSGAGSTSTSITIPSNSSKTIWIYAQSFFANMTVDASSSAKNTTVEIDIQRDGNTIFNGALNYYRSTSIGWTTK